MRLASMILFNQAPPIGKQMMENSNKIQNQVSKEHCKSLQLHRERLNFLLINMLNAHVHVMETSLYLLV